MFLPLKLIHCRFKCIKQHKNNKQNNHHHGCHIIFYIIQNELPRLKHYVHKYLYLWRYFCWVFPEKKNCIHRGHYFVFCAGVGILTTASDHNFASNFFYVAWKHSIHVICDIDHWQKKVLISQDVFICVVHYSNVITGNLFLLTYYNYSHFFFIPDIVYINLIS